MRQNNRQLTPLGTVIFFAAMLNFLVYVAIAQAIGGDAWSGKVDGGQYFLSNHGHLTVVTAGVWKYSWWHTVSIFITHPLGIAAAGLCNRRRRSFGRNTAGRATGSSNITWEVLRYRQPPDR